LIVRTLHSWDVTTQGAREIQEKLRRRVSFKAPGRLPRLAAGADVSYNKFSPNLYAAAIVVDLESLDTIEEAGITAKASFPYVPGLLSFREVPPLLSVFRKLRTRPQLVICDGQGYAHPRRFGLACHLGLILDLPSLGCAKSRLIGDYEDPGNNRGDFTALEDGEEVIGSVLRTRTGVSPVFISVGHRMSLEMARELVLRLTPSYRLPETTRRAHHLVNELRRASTEDAGRRSHRGDAENAEKDLLNDQRQMKK